MNFLNKSWLETQGSIKFSPSWCASSRYAKKYFDKVISNFFNYKLNKNGDITQYGDCQKHTVGYCWAAFDLVLPFSTTENWRLDWNLYTGKSSSLQSRLNSKDKGYTREEKFLLYTTDNFKSEKSNYAKTMSDFWDDKVKELGLIIPNWHSDNVMEQSNINAIKKYISGCNAKSEDEMKFGDHYVYNLNKRDESGHSFYNPELYIKIKQLEEHVCEANDILGELQNYAKNGYVTNNSKTAKERIEKVSSILNKTLDKIDPVDCINLSTEEISNKILESVTFRTKGEEQPIDQEWVKIISKFNNLKCDKDESFMLLRDVFHETFRRKLSDLEYKQTKSISKYNIDTVNYYRRKASYDIQHGSLELLKRKGNSPIIKVREKPTPPVELFETYTFFQDMMKTLDIVKDNARLERNRKSRERRKKKNEIGLSNWLDKSKGAC